MHPDEIDLKADGTHAYCANLDGRGVRITVDPETLQGHGLTAVEEPLFVRRTLELVPVEALTGEVVALEELGAQVQGYPEVVVARLRT